ncbi:methylated-DNA-[protein]-cysteine S-methyltransferase [Chitinophaga jiangningensis]|uniref:Methylated-DNA--protein-cysteine methyltransferase n=1 Tax=Chitinophaga jiangningensis TaxID=1419482 RepID=A0A1M6Y268_9BACT|nr:methylated-DNA--[protein]-cysteine S-methyltransferase [Chitinophaga jiangningensis]SHL12223.1 methylated-DNA-[protein]-cysteine S-methyltransferase [Chitinophaga jiangningensis]
MDTLYHLRIDTPVGALLISGTTAYITSVHFTDDPEEDFHEAPPLLLECAQQLFEYFAGDRREFDLPISQHGSTFQHTVWNQLVKIPYGHTITYLQLAKRINNVKSIRAVGTTNGKNALAIIVPCHRVVGANGVLTGYAGGLWRKRWLLDHERGDLFTGLR